MWRSSLIKQRIAQRAKALGFLFLLLHFGLLAVATMPTKLFCPAGKDCSPGRLRRFALAYNERSGLSQLPWDLFGSFTLNNHYAYRVEIFDANRPQNTLRIPFRTDAVSALDLSARGQGSRYYRLAESLGEHRAEQAFFNLTSYWLHQAAADLASPTIRARLIQRHFNPASKSGPEETVVMELEMPEDAAP
jgi:hypothetical protein